MSDELRAAAENIIADYEYAEKQAFTMWKGRTLADALKLARGYLAKHPSDSGDAGTCAMLQESLTVIELLLGASDSGRLDDARRRKIAVTFLDKAKGLVK